jgi:UDP-N-acetylglucosamine 4,6-dehydratase (inverting)
MLNNKTILITGGTGSFGKKFLETILNNYKPKRVIIYSRDEFKQSEMKQLFSKRFDMTNVRFFIGDIRDKDRLYRAFHEVDYVIHAAAMKQVPTCEYNPFEAIKTNIYGAQNIIDAAIDRGIKKVVALSTDKAVNPINLYGGTKLVSDKLFISANAYSKISGTKFSVVRYGNVANSRGSVIPYFNSLIEKGIYELPITDLNMTRFWISLEEGVSLVLKALNESEGGETFISKIPSFKVIDLAIALTNNKNHKVIGIREGEKIHELMISKDDNSFTYEYENHFIIFPNFDWSNKNNPLMNYGKKVKSNFEYNSGTNDSWLNIEDLTKKLKLLNKNNIL